MNCIGSVIFLTIALLAGVCADEHNHIVSVNNLLLFHVQTGTTDDDYHSLLHY